MLQSAPHPPPSVHTLSETRIQSSQGTENAVVPDIYSNYGSFEALVYAWLFCIATTSCFVLFNHVLFTYVGPSSLLLYYLFGYGAIPGCGLPFFSVACVLLAIGLAECVPGSLQKRKVFKSICFMLYSFVILQSLLSVFLFQLSWITLAIVLFIYFGTSVYRRYEPIQCRVD